MILGHPDGGNVLLSAARWVQDLLLGPIATGVAVIAVASIGFLMLSGRLNLRRGATVIMGCFILFGAANIAQGLRALAQGGARGAQSRPAAAPPPAPSIGSPAAPPSQSVEVSDPYAGASVRR